MSGPLLMKGFNENLRLALGTISSHKLRSALTVLGVVIGVTCVIAIGSILTGLDRAVTDSLRSFGTDNIFISKFPPGITIGPLIRSSPNSVSFCSQFSYGLFVIAMVGPMEPNLR